MKPLRRAAFPLCALAAAALAIFAYSNTFENVFQMDDYHVLVNNGYVRSLRNVPLFFRDARTFGSEVTNQTYRPLVSTSLAIDYAIGGGRTPFVFRLTQLTLMLASGALLYFVYRLLLDGAGESSLNRWLALGASTLFVVHTANSEVANYVSSRSDLLSTMGVVGSFAVYLGWPRRRRAQLHLLPMAMGALAKTPSLMYAPMIVAHRWLYETEGDWRARLRAAIVPALPAFAVSVVLFIFIESRNPPTQTYGGGPWYDYALSQPFCWLHYARLFFVPAGLTADYGWKPVAHAYDTRVFAGAAFLLLLAWAIVRAARTQALRPASFGLCWFALALLPTSSVIPISEVVKESRVFFPNVGLAIAVVTSLSYFMNTLVVQWSSRAIAVTSLGSALVLGSLAIATRE